MKRTSILILGAMLLLSHSLWAGGNKNEGPSVSLIYAEGQIFYHEVYITWSTEKEVPNTDFIIEASSDQKNWNIRGRVRGKGVHGAPQDYKFVDERNEQHRFYRIRQLSPGDNNVLSEITPENYSIEISLHDVTIEDAHKLIIHYSIDKDQDIMLRMYDRIGEQIVTKVMPFNEKGEHLYMMSLKGVKRGNYLIQIVQVLSNKIVAEKQFSI